MRHTREEFVRFLKLRLAVLAATTVIVATGLLGLIDLLSTTTVDTAPVYVHVTAGATVFPVTVFALEYRGIETVDAVRLGAVAAVASVLLFLLLSEGAGRMTDGSLGFGAPTLFYVVTVSLVASTVFVAWLDRVYLDVPSAHRGTRSRDGRE